jgi:hypothetical protein
MLTMEEVVRLPEIGLRAITSILLERGMSTAGTGMAMVVVVVMMVVEGITEEIEIEIGIGM